MNSHRRTGYVAGIATLLTPFAVPFAAPPTAAAATALFAEGATRQSGEAQSAFGGAFCEENTCRSLGRGTITPSGSARRIQDAVDSTPGEIIVAGYSVGAAGVYNRLRTWEEDPTLAPDPERVVLVVTFGNPENKFGGDNRRVPGTGLPQTQPYDHLDVVAQYDSVADSPTRFGFYSAVNSLFSNRHFAYFEGLDVNDPDNLVYQEGNTTYMLIPAETLPMVSWLAPFVSDERLAELDAKYRPLVERDYDRPAYTPQGEGADWGNGTPPPSLQDPVAEPDQTTTETGESESQSPGRVAGADEPSAEDSAGAEWVSVSASADAAPHGDDAQTSAADDPDSGLAETDVAAEVANEESEVDQSDADDTREIRGTREADDSEESADADESARTEGSDDATDSDKTDSDSGDSDKAGSDSGGSDSSSNDKAGGDKAGD
ncbi:PE-PPE domain-containing protein [Mycobacterium sp. G7A2]|uniref:PE-PPE domain-containing protein n=1 Tax=Mycobacterium sp. G7A2 TaxID=3317307 RepID=UPI0035A85754